MFPMNPTKVDTQATALLKKPPLMMPGIPRTGELGGPTWGRISLKEERVAFAHCRGTHMHTMTIDSALLTS